MLRCRWSWLAVYGIAAAGLLYLGTDALVASLADPAADVLTFWTPPILLLGGAGCAYFVARHCLATVTLHDRGFRVAGPLGRIDVDWTAIVGYARVPQRWGPAFLRLIHGDERRRLTIPLIYEDGHLLETGMAQRKYPDF